MTSRSPATPTRWAGIPGPERVRERRALLVEATFDLLGTEGEAATSIRAVCRRADLNARYFYESFTDREELLGATYDRVAEELAARLADALAEPAATPAQRCRAGIDTVLRFITDDPRRASVLFTEGRTIEVLADRRRQAQRTLADGIAELGRSELGPATPSTVADVTAAMFGGAMDELARSWLEGRLGTDLDRVVDDAVALSLALFDGARDR